MSPGLALYGCAGRSQLGTLMGSGSGRLIPDESMSITESHCSHQFQVDLHVMVSISLVSGYRPLPVSYPFLLSATRRHLKTKSRNDTAVDPWQIPETSWCQTFAEGQTT
jgi:hypothetical protein